MGAYSEEIAVVVVRWQISRRKREIEESKNKVTEAALILKAPRVGEVKTRLASSIGAERATRIYRALVEHQLAQIPANWRTVIHFAPSDAEAEMRSWLGRFVPLKPSDFVPQPNGDLGSRLISAMNHGFASGADFVFFLGGDCPGLTCSYLEEAEAALVETDMIIASARDGGYVLLGLRKPMASIFEGIQWSSETVFATTLRIAIAAGLSFRCLQPLEDVDDLESYARQCAKVRNLAEMDDGAAGVN
jgi:rSAM/selenodomain-associated transferase 1